MTDREHKKVVSITRAHGEPISATSGGRGRGTAPIRQISVGSSSHAALATNWLLNCMQGAGLREVSAWLNPDGSGYFLLPRSEKTARMSGQDWIYLMSFLGLDRIYNIQFARSAAQSFTKRQLRPEHNEGMRWMAVGIEFDSQMRNFAGFDICTPDTLAAMLQFDGVPGPEEDGSGTMVPEIAQERGGVAVTPDSEEEENPHGAD